MGAPVLPLLAALLAAVSAAGEPAGAAHVDGAPPSKIGKESQSGVSLRSDDPELFSLRDNIYSLTRRAVVLMTPL